MRSNGQTNYSVRYHGKRIEWLKQQHPLRYISIDVETTGLSCFNDRIVELSAVLFENGQIKDEFTSLVNPQCHIPDQVIAIHGIDDAMVANAPFADSMIEQWNEKMPWLCDLTTVFVAHNARFDMSFLAQTMQRAGYQADLIYVDVLESARRYIHLDNYRLNTVASYFDISNPHAHRAYADALTCGKIMWELIQRVNG